MDHEYLWKKTQKKSRPKFQLNKMHKIDFQKLQQQKNKKQNEICLNLFWKW